MAARRHRGYLDNEFRESESGYELSRKDAMFSKQRHDRIGNGSQEYARDRVRVRVRDLKDMNGSRIRQRDELNGGTQSSFIRSNSGSSSGNEGAAGPRHCDFVAKAVDREPGELSSDSGSDAAIETESQPKVSDVLEVAGNDIIKAPGEKKRKFSPIVWDRDDKKLSNSSKVNVSHQEVTSLPPPPSLPNLQHESLDVTIEKHVGISSTRSAVIHNAVSSSPIEDPVAISIAEPESPIELVAPTSLSDKHQLDEGLKSVALEDEDYVPARHISSSRWAAGNSSPIDEGEIVEDEEIHKRRKKVPNLDSSGSRLHSKSVTPDGDPKREGSDGARFPTSNDPGSQARSLSADDYPNTESERDEYMEIDGDHGYKNSSIDHSDTDSEDENENGLQRTPEPAGPPPRSVNMLRGCRSVDEFERLNKIDEGTYGVVFRAKDKITGEIVALKKVKMEKEREGFPLTALREINILLSFHHPSVVDVKEVVVGSSLDSIFMVMEYMEHDLKALMESMKQPFSQSEVKCLMLQLLEGTKYLHDNWVLHRDLKTSNLLLNNRGELKICDFGLARQYGSPLKPYTHMVVTLWYRAPELLLGAQKYSTAIDMWSLGCIMAELLSKKPLFNGKTEFDQLDKIFRTLGTPNESIWPGFSKLPNVKVNFVKQQYNLLRKKFPATSFTGSPVLSDAGFDLLNKLLTYDPEKRITADAALNHEWFREVPLPKSKDFMPTFPAQHAQDRRARRVLKSPDPLEEQRRKELRQAELGTGGLFG